MANPLTYQQRKQLLKQVVIKENCQNKVTLFPAVEVTGFSTGYTRVGYRNSIPAQAVAKVNFRTAPSQDPKRLLTILNNWLAEQFSDYVDGSWKLMNPQQEW